MKAHPDHGGTNEETRLVLHAYKILSDAESRRKYDATIAGPTRVSPYAGVPSGNGPPQWPKGWPRRPPPPAPKTASYVDWSKIDWDEVIKARDRSPFGNDNVGGQFVSMAAELGRQMGAQAGKKK